MIPLRSNGSSNDQEPLKMRSQGGSVVSRVKVVLFAMPILMASLLVSAGNAQQQQTPTKAVQLTGLEGVKDSTEGSLTIENGNLRFTHSKSNSDLAPSSMQDVVT